MCNSFPATSTLTVAALCSALFFKSILAVTLPPRLASSYGRYCCLLDVGPKPFGSYVLLMCGSNFHERYFCSHLQPARILSRSAHSYQCWSLLLLFLLQWLLLHCCIVARRFQPFLFLRYAASTDFTVGYCNSVDYYGRFQ